MIAMKKIYRCQAALIAAALGIFLNLNLDLAAAEPPAAPSGLNPGVVAANAAWYLQADFERLKETQFGQAILRELEAPQFARPLEGLQVALNFDPRRSLFGATVYGPAFNLKEVVILASGKLDIDQLQGLVTANKEYQGARHGNYVIHGWQNNRRAAPDGGESRIHLAIHTNGMVIAGTQIEQVKTALDVLDKIEPGLGKDKDKALAGFDAPPDKTFLVIAASRPATLPERIPAAVASVLKEMKALRLTASEADGKLILQLQVLATDEAMARNYQSILDGAKAALAMQQDQPQLANLAGALTVTQAGNKAIVTLKGAPEDGMKLIKLAIARRAGRNAER